MSVDYSRVVFSYSLNVSLLYKIKIIVYTFFFELSLTCYISSNSNILAISSCQSRGPKHLEMLRNNSFKGVRNEVYLNDKFTIKRFHIFLYCLIKFFVFRKKKIVLSLLKLKFQMDKNNIIKKFDNELTHTKYIISLCDAVPYENLFIQVANIFECNTFTCQHGLYSYNDKKPSPDDSTYKCFVSDYLFCWGEGTKSEFIKAGIDTGRLISVGNQTVDKEYVENIKSKIDCSFNENHMFGVLFSGENQKNVNFKLLLMAETISKHLGIKYIVRMHPKNIESDYQNLVSNACLHISIYNDLEYFTSTDFSISYQTGVIALALELEHQIYIFDDGNLSGQFLNKNFNFSTEEEFLKMFKNGRGTFHSFKNYLSSDENDFYFPSYCH